MHCLSTDNLLFRSLRRRQVRDPYMLAVLVLAVLSWCAPPSAAVDPAMMARVRARAESCPDDPIAWRLYGKALLSAGDVATAEQALLRAAELDPQRAAVHSDLADAQTALGRHELARQSLLRVVEMAPETSFARDAEQQLAAMDKEDNPFRLATFQPSWIESATGETTELTAPDAPAPFTWRVEAGVLFNSNVDLAPISRQLSPDQNGGFQAFLEPDMQYTWVKNDSYNAGVQFAGFFAFNEPDNSDFNLQHYQPGIYVELPRACGDWEIVSTLSYDFAYDIFGGATLGTRHELAASMTATDLAGHSWTVFWAGDMTEFRDDGDDPPVTSLDGPTQTIGIARRWQLSHSMFDSVRLSADGQWAELTGADQAYRGAFFLLTSTCVLSECWELRPELGWGFRTYPDFTGTPDRDESIWRTRAEFRRWLSSRCYLSLDGSYDRFDSDNEEYAAERFTAGMSATMLH